MGYQKTPTLSSNNYKKNAGVGGSGRFGGSSGLSSNTYKQKTSVGASNSARYGGSSSLSTNGYKGRSNGYGGSKIVGSVGGSGVKGYASGGAVLRARASPRALLKGFQVICDVEKVKDLTTTIFVASEDNMEEALTAIQKGIPTFSMIVSAEEEEFNNAEVVKTDLVFLQGIKLDQDTFVFSCNVLVQKTSVFTCGYIALQFFKLSPAESSKNPIYFVLARHQKGDVVGHKRRHSVVIAKVIVAALGCFMLGFLTHAIIVDGSPFQAKIDFSNELQVVDAFEKEMERASTYLLSSSLPELVETYYGRSFVGTSDGYFSILFLLAGRSCIHYKLPFFQSQRSFSADVYAVVVAHPSLFDWDVSLFYFWMRVGPLLVRLANSGKYTFLILKSLRAKALLNVEVVSRHDSSHHSSTNAAEAGIDSLVQAPALEIRYQVITSGIASMFHDSDFTGTVKLDAAGSSYVPEKELSMRSRDINSETIHEVFVPQWNVSNWDLSSFVHEFHVGTAVKLVDSGTDLQKARDAKVESLKAQLLLKETKAAEATRLYAQVSTTEATEKIPWYADDRFHDTEDNVKSWNENDSLVRRSLCSNLWFLTWILSGGFKKKFVLCLLLGSTEDGLVDKVHAWENTVLGFMIRWEKRSPQGGQENVQEDAQGNAAFFAIVEFEKEELDTTPEHPPC
ncbi:reverse transcriptase, RNA-dependent DNA polymerase [Tanacetum coccineum]